MVRFAIGIAVGAVVGALITAKVLLKKFNKDLMEAREVWSPCVDVDEVHEAEDVKEVDIPKEEPEKPTSGRFPWGESSSPVVNHMTGIIKDQEYYDYGTYTDEAPEIIPDEYYDPEIEKKVMIIDEAEFGGERDEYDEPEYHTYEWTWCHGDRTMIDEREQVVPQEEWEDLCGIKWLISREWLDQDTIYLRNNRYASDICIEGSPKSSTQIYESRNRGEGD